MQTLRAQLQNLCVKALDTVLPPRCVVTGETVERQGMIAPKAWSSLDFITRPFCECCGFPFSFVVEEGMLCSSCLADAPPFESARSALTYNDTSRDLILGFKHADKTYAVKAFTPWLERAGEDMIKEADFLVPVPLHRQRLIARRYNQAGIMAQALSKETNVPVLIDALQRVRATRSQGHLKARERHKNVRKAFIVPETYRETLRGKTVILIDDVYTTGATLKECTKALLAGGAEKVHALTLARVAREE